MIVEPATGCRPAAPAPAASTLLFCSSAVWMRRSTSRTASRYSEIRVRSPGPSASLQPREILVDAIEQAALPLHPIEPLFGRAAFAEQPLEHDARVVLVRQRRRRRLPRHRVHVRAAVARLALAAEHEVDFRRDQLHRRQHAFPCRTAPPQSDRPSSPRRMSAPSVFFGCTPFSQVAQARVCSPLPSPSDSPCFCARPLTIVRRSRYGASGARIGENSKSAPGPFRRPVVDGCRSSRRRWARRRTPCGISASAAPLRGRRQTPAPSRRAAAARTVAPKPAEERPPR